MSNSLICRMVAPPCRHSPRAAILKAGESAGNIHMVSTEKSTAFWRIVEGLKVFVPPAMPVVVVVGRAGSRCDGFCERKRTGFRIVISENLDEDHAIDVLQHEWSHALAWTLLDDRLGRRPRLTAREYDRLSHGPEWGVAFSKTYQALITEIYPALAKGVTLVPRKPWRRK